MVLAVIALTLTTVLASNARSHREPRPTQNQMSTTEDSKSNCGNWMRDYTHLHKSVRSGAKGPRYLMVQVKETSGLADMFACISSAFLCALLSDRALIIDESDESSRLSVAYFAPNIDWTYQPPELESLSRKTVHGIGTNGPPAEGPDIDIFHWGNLSSFGSEELVILKDCNAGLIIPLFDNPFYKFRLYELGLTPETAYGCIFSFLFGLRSTAKDTVKKEIEAMEDSRYIKIGIHIRTSDPTMANQELRWPSHDEAERELANYRAYFSCALEIEEKISRASKKEILWLILSDSMLLRKSAVVVHGKKILTKIEDGRPPRHVRSSQGGGGADAMSLSAGEHWLFSLADYHIFGFGGFGKSAALSSNKWGYYNVHRDPSCKAVSVRELSDVTPGI